jgi:hypothetical protein
MLWLLWAGCDSFLCPEADRAVSDHEPVSGVTAAEVQTVVGSFAVPLDWEFGPATDASGEVEILDGGARSVARPDCVCEGLYPPLSTPCEAAELVQAARARLWTADGRVDVVVDGEVAAQRVDGRVRWEFLGEVGWAELGALFSPADLDLRSDSVLQGYTVWLLGDEARVVALTVSTNTRIGEIGLGQYTLATSPADTGGTAEVR